MLKAVVLLNIFVETLHGTEIFDEWRTLKKSSYMNQKYFVTLLISLLAFLNKFIASI